MEENNNQFEGSQNGAWDNGSNGSNGWNNDPEATTVMSNPWDQSSMNNQGGFTSDGSQQAYEGQNGYMPENSMNGYGNQNGYMSENSMNGYGNQNGYMPENNMNGYGNQNGYMPENSMNGYGNQNGYMPENSMNGYGNQNGYMPENSMNGYGNQNGYMPENSMNGYGNQNGYMPENSMNGYGNQNGYMPENSMNGYGNQNGYMPENSMNGYGNNFGYSQENSMGNESFAGYGQNQGNFAYGQNGFDANGMNPQGNPSPEKSKKMKKIWIIVFSVAFVVMAAAIAVAVYFLTGKSDFPKNIEDYKWNESHSYSDFLDAYYNGSKSDFEDSAKSPNYDKLLKNPDKYVNTAFVVEGFVTEINGDLFYVEEEKSGKEYCFYNTTHKKNSVSEDDYVSVYAIFTQVKNEIPCMAAWEIEVIDYEPSIESIEPAVEPTEEPTVTAEPDEPAVSDSDIPPIPDSIDYSPEEQAYIDNLSVSKLDGVDSDMLYYYIQNNNVGSNDASLTMYVYFYKDGEVIAYDEDYINFSGDQPYSFGYVYCEDANYHSLEYDDAVYYFDDVYIYSTYRTECLFDQMDLNVSSVDSNDWSMKYTITNNTGKTVNAGGTVVFYNADGLVTDVEYIFQSEVAIGDTEYEDYYFGDDNPEKFDIFWSYVY